MNCWSQHQGYELTAEGSGCKTATVTDDGYRIESDTPKSAGGGGIERVAQNKGEYFFRFLELWGPLYEAYSIKTRGMKGTIASDPKNYSKNYSINGHVLAGSSSLHLIFSVFGLREGPLAPTYSSARFFRNLFEMPTLNQQVSVG